MWAIAGHCICNKTINFTGRTFGMNHDIGEFGEPVGYTLQICSRDSSCSCLDRRIIDELLDLQTKFGDLRPNGCGRIRTNRAENRPSDVSGCPDKGKSRVGALSFIDPPLLSPAPLYSYQVLNG